MNSFLKRAIGYLGIAALVLATWQVAQRYLFPQNGFVWVEEVVIYIFAWATYLGVSVLIFENKHVRADLIVRTLPLGAQRAVEVFNCIIGLLFCSLICWFGGMVTIDAYVLDERSVTGAAFPIWIFYASLPVGMFFASLRFLYRTYRLLFRFDATSFDVRSGHDA